MKCFHICCFSGSLFVRNNRRLFQDNKQSNIRKIKGKITVFYFEIYLKNFILNFQSLFASLAHEFYHLVSN